MLRFTKIVVATVFGCDYRLLVFVADAIHDMTNLERFSHHGCSPAHLIS